MTNRALKNRVAELMAKKARQENRPRITQRQIAEETGLSLLTINQYIKNRVTRFDKQTLETFADYFGCDIGELLILEENHGTDEDPPKLKSPHLPLLAS